MTTIDKLAETTTTTLNNLEETLTSLRGYIFDDDEHRTEALFILQDAEKITADGPPAELPPITCGQTMIGGPCDRPSLHEGPDENPLSRDIAKAKRIFAKGSCSE